MKAIRKSDRKMQIRQEAKRKVGGAKYDYAGDGATAYRESVDQGLKQLKLKSSEAGDTRPTKVKNELMYLLNNYLPKNDARILYLIDEWRKSGDPEYDPSIKARLRTARQNHMKGNSI